MENSSLDVIESFTGEPLDDAIATQLSTGPEQHIIDLVLRLDKFWDAWLTAQAAPDHSPEMFYFLAGSQYETQILPVSYYKRSALYFPTIAMPDPVEVAIAVPMFAWAATDMVDATALREGFAQGVRMLVEIAPLIRAGAVEMVPSTHASLSRRAQAIARETSRIAVEDEKDIQSASYFELQQYACATGVCTACAYWPLASSRRLWERLDAGADDLAKRTRGDVTVEKAVAQFDLPSTALVPLNQLLLVRADEQSFSDFREAIGVAFVEAARVATQDGAEYAVKYVREQLELRRAQCETAARRINALDGLLLPTGAILTAAGLSWALGFSPIKGAPELTKLATDALAPGAAWLAARLFQELSPKVKQACAAAAVYGALVEK
ncbi:hypothetical protein [Paraburkholderia tuberum]|uniref:Uncharacterized protein n=1 Tax=Paraburkholderia tuberum TaxID=157910 RepID=A0A1H1D9F5_9BURK|nr:hypothetical protein [Paraburkholderia tuberum]SDQ73191.1 hypothetical protein SAMN05445850_1571 [Paraburkholderia tuberum]